MSCMPSGLAVIAIGQKKPKTKNVTHAIWSGFACQRAKILGKNEKCSACHLAMIGERHWQKRGKNKKFHARHLVWPCLPMGPNIKEKQDCQACHKVWPWPSLAKKREKQKMSRMPSGLALPAKGPKF
jgi:hypothetical protein